MVQPDRRDIAVGGIRTSWLEVGDGPVLLLLHGGAWGESAATAWGPVLQHYPGRRLLAPDWLGFGASDKLRDFIDLQGRMIGVLASWLDAIGVDACDAVGLSMGGANLLRDQSSPQPALPVRRQVLISAGGLPISGEARTRLADYDGSMESMRVQVALACADPALAADVDVVAARHQASLLPGAYEMMASLGLRSPAATPPPQGDPVPYEQVQVPTLLVVGGRDQLKPAGFADEAARRLPRGELREFATAGHCVQLDQPADLAGAVLTFTAPSVPQEAA